jgi:hypothetical protein
MDATVLEPDHALKAKLLVEVEPGVDSVRLAAFQEAMVSDSMRRHAIGDLQQRSAAFTDVGSWIVVTVMTKLVGLGLSQVEGSTVSSHGICLSPVGSHGTNLLPVLLVKNH